MKTLLVAEFREGKLRAEYTQLIAFAQQQQTEAAMFVVGSGAELPRFNGTLYLADVAQYGEYNPTVHKQLLLEVIAKEQPEQIVFLHSSYGWDLAPRIAVSLKAAQIAEVVAIEEGDKACRSLWRRAQACNLIFQQTSSIQHGHHFAEFRFVRILCA